MKSTMSQVAAIAVLTVSANAAQAVVVAPGSILTINAGNFTTSSAVNIAYNGGSFFGMDLNSNEKIALSEGTAITQGTTGITIGQATTVHGEIDADWVFNGSAGRDFLMSAISGDTTTGLTMNGWTVNWNGGDIAMGGGAWQSNPVNPTTNNIMAQQTYSNSIANFSWSGVYGDAYTLDYTATVPTGSFSGTQYYLHLEGTVQAVPEASTYGMMLAGLGLIGGMVARRRKIFS